MYNYNKGKIYEKVCIVGCSTCFLSGNYACSMEDSGEGQLEKETELYSFSKTELNKLAVVRLFTGVVSHCLVVTKNVTYTCDKITKKEFESLTKQNSNLFKNNKLNNLVLVAAYDKSDELVKIFVTLSPPSSTEFQSSYIKNKAVVTVEDTWDKYNWLNKKVDGNPRWKILSLQNNILEVCCDSSSGSINGGSILNKIPGGFFKRETLEEYIKGKGSFLKKNYILNNSENQDS